MNNNVNDGAFELLQNTGEVLAEFPELEYVVIGGWCPFLRNESELAHSGTIDVDILFKDSYKTGVLKDFIIKLYASDFLPSAKHPFQIFKRIQVGTTDLIFNIDLLHPNMTEDKESIGMFVDHLDLDIPLDKEEKRTKKTCSIVLPNSRILFDHKMFDKFNIESTTVNLVSFEGMFITKMDSCQKQKRERDSFDIYLAFLNDGINTKKLRELASFDTRINKSLLNLRAFLRKNPDIFNRNVKMFAKHLEGSPAKYILEKLNA